MNDTLGLRARSNTRKLLGALLAVGIVVATAAATPADAASGVVQMSAKVLVLDDGSPTVEAITERMLAEGQQFYTIDLASSSRQQVTNDFLATSSGGTITANFSGVVTPNEAPVQLSEAERSTLFGYEAAFNVRQLNAYTWAHPEVGLNYAANPGYIGTLDGMTASLTGAALAGDFAYLKNSLDMDDLSDSVSESYGYLALPLAGADFTPLLTANIPETGESGSLMGTYRTDGREQMVVTFSYNQYQQHWQVLSHGVLNWLTRGLSTSYHRNYLSVHVDDVLLPDGLWSVEGNCTIGDDCDPAAYPTEGPGAEARMVPADVTALRTWQQQAGIKLDLVFNGAGATEAAADTGRADQLERSLLASKSEFRWVNHTWSHLYLGCEQNFSTVPWTCSTSGSGATAWVRAATIRSEVKKNLSYAARNRLPNWDASAVVTGEHSGLKSLPQMTTDNPRLAPSLSALGIKWVASDASRERDTRRIGSATTVPRHPMNIYYNTATKLQAIDEYNWIYTSRADGGSGTCEDYPETTTCIAPLDPVTGFNDFIVGIETRIAMGHVVSNDSRPHYVHQTNLTQDRIIYPVLDSVMSEYNQLFAANTPLINPTMADAGTQLLRQERWAQANGKVTTHITGTTVTVTNKSSVSVTAPVTVPNRNGSSFGSAYSNQRSGWTAIPAGGSVSINVGVTGFANVATWPSPDPVLAGDVNPVNLVQPRTEQVRLPEADTELLTMDS